MSAAPSSGFPALLRDFRTYAGPRLWLNLLVMLAGSLAEGFGLLMIVPLASIATGRDSGIFTHFAQALGAASQGRRFALALAIFVAAMAARSALLFARDLQVARLQAGYEASLRIRAAAVLAARGWPFASRIGQAGMQSLLLNDAPRAAHAIGFTQNAAIHAVMLAVQLTLAAILSPLLTAVAAAILVIGGIMSRGWLRRGVQRGMAISETAEESASSGFRLHAGLKAALAQGTVPPFLAEYRSTLKRASAQILQLARDYSSAQQLSFLTAAMTAALLLLIGIRFLSLPFPLLIAALVLFARMSGPARGLQQSLQQVAAFAPSFAVIQQRLGKLEPATEVEQSREPLEWTELRIEGAGFEHQPGLGLKDATLTLRAGEWLGLGGPSGSGKTTLIDLVAGLLSPEQGRIAVDGQALTGEALEGWRAGLAYVGQEGTVFNDSVRGNLLAEGSNAGEAEQWEALELVGLSDRVRALPDGLDESVGDRGSQLSGGERQRLALARALLRRPRLMLLDEATAALDAASEAALLGRLRSIEPRPASIVVAHRDSTLSHCDSVVSIQHGMLRKSAE